MQRRAIFIILVPVHACTCPSLDSATRHRQWMQMVAWTRLKRSRMLHKLPSLLSFLFTPLQATVGLRKASTAGKNSSVGSARQPSLTQSKEVDLAAISYVRSAPPTIPLVWARSAVTAKVSFRFCSVKSSAPLASNASQRNERAMWSLELGRWAVLLASTAALPYCQQLILTNLNWETSAGKFLVQITMKPRLALLFHS